jgi:hypothetical protein
MVFFGLRAAFAARRAAAPTTRESEYVALHSVTAKAVP